MWCRQHSSFLQVPCQRWQPAGDLCCGVPCGCAAATPIASAIHACHMAASECAAGIRLVCVRSEFPNIQHMADWPMYCYCHTHCYCVACRAAHAHMLVYERASTESTPVYRFLPLRLRLRLLVEVNVGLQRTC